MFGGLDEFFAPGRRHTEEELRRQALTREDPGDADPSRGPIDLRSGRVTIRTARPVPADGTTADGTTAEEAAADGPDDEAAADGPVEEPGDGSPSAPAEDGGR
ncbi:MULTISPECIES: DUF6191 domain-containing protein [unclassified Streptomyces]|uniref:DUF6191 domain-containing protein n=1 Tax=unclassified Streptomyces TaxID=2593676 RepID=UPI0007C89CB2|nr:MULTISPECIES: DUF6191 domain-containing protein [unclassified Streptomyces]